LSSWSPGSLPYRDTIRQTALVCASSMLVDSQVHEKPMSIALREINEGLLTHTAGEN